MNAMMGRKARDKRSRPVPLAAPAPDPATGAAAEAAKDVARPTPASVSVARAARRPRRRAAGLSPLSVLWLGAIAVTTFAVYAGAVDNPFLLDDPINITKSESIKQSLKPAALAVDPRAVVTMSLRANYLLGGFAETGYHVFNVLAHVVAGGLVFVLALMTLRLRPEHSPAAGRATGRDEALAGVIALVFLLHPIQTESVTYVIQRAEILVSAALLGALVALASMRDGVTKGSMAAMAAACLVGSYSKPSFAVAPALLALYDLCFLARGRVRELLQRWPAYALATAAAAFTFVLTKAGGAFEANTAGFEIEGISPAAYLTAQPGVIVQYLRVSLWPNDLCFDCGYRGPWPVVASWMGDSLLIPALILLALVAASLVAWKRWPLLTFAVLGTFVVLAPTSSFVPLADFYVEHRMYLPIALLAMALVPGACVLLGAAASRLQLGASPLRALQIGVAALVVAGLATATMARNRLLADPIALMEDALELAPQNERVHYNLANAYKRDKRYAEAIPHYEEAIRLLPNVVRSYQNLGSLYSEQGKLDEALRVYLAGAAAKPEVAMAHRNVANTYLRLGRDAEALEAAQRAVALDRSNPNGRRLEGDALASLGRTEEAARVWREGLAANPGDATLKDRISKLGRR